MAGIPDSSGDQQNRKQILLDYFCDHLDQVHTAEELSAETGMSLEDVEIAVEALAYEKEVAKEYGEGGQKGYRRKA